MPEVLRNIAASQKVKANITTHTLPDYEIQQHVKNKDTMDLLRRSTWDSVVFNENNFILINEDWRANELFPPMEKLSAALKEAGVQGSMFQNYGFKKGVPFSKSDSYEKMQKTLIDVTARVSGRNGFRVIPIGMAWQRMYEKHPEINLWASDTIHPNVHGTYLIACLVYSNVFNKVVNAKSYVPHGIGTNEADIIRTECNGVMKDYFLK